LFEIVPFEAFSCHRIHRFNEYRKGRDKAIARVGERNKGNEAGRCEEIFLC
jgi:hypothetical protein